MINVNYYLQKTSDENLYLIFMQVKHNTKKLYFSFNEKVSLKYWDLENQRIIVSEETKRNGLATLNITLEKLEEHFYKLYYEFQARGKIDFVKIRKLLKIFYNDNKLGKLRLNAYRYVSQLDKCYLKKLLKKRGFTDEIIDENPELQKIVKLIIQTQRICKSQTSNNLEKAWRIITKK